MTAVAWVNDRFVDPSEPAVAVDDRGLQFGEAAYETVGVYQGRTFRLDAHLARFRRSLEAMGIPFGDDDLAALAAAVRACVQHSGEREALVYLQVTGGVAPRAHVVERRPRPTRIITVRPFHALGPEVFARGTKAITVPEIRWGRCDIKSTNLLANVLARQAAQDQGAFAAIFVDAEGRVTEADRSNVFAVIDGVVRTAPQGAGILSGVTRDAVLEVMREAGVAFAEQSFTVQALRAADEAFLTGTTVEVLAITDLDGRALAGGRPGPVALRLRSLYRERLRERLDR